MRRFDELKETTNSSVYNKLRKEDLELHREISCSHCPYHCGENNDKKEYGKVTYFDNNDEHMRYPSWKLVSKNKKQWMANNVKIVVTKWIDWSGYERKGVDIEF